MAAAAGTHRPIAGVGIGAGRGVSVGRRLSRLSATTPDSKKQPTSPVPYAEFFRTKEDKKTTKKKSKAPSELPPSPAAIAAMAARAAQAAVVASASTTKRPARSAAARAEAAAGIPLDPSHVLPPWASQPGAETLRVRTRAGATVYAAVVAAAATDAAADAGAAAGGDFWRVAVAVSPADAVRGGGAPGQAPHLHWGLYRAPGAAWRLPPPLPEGTARDDKTGAGRTPMRLVKGAWFAEMRVPRRYAPVQFGFALWHPPVAAVLPPSQSQASPSPAAAAPPPTRRHKKLLPAPPALQAAVDYAARGVTGGLKRAKPQQQSGSGCFDPSPAGGHFALPVGIGRGAPAPLGPSVVGAVRRVGASSSSPYPASADVNFAVYSRHAGAVTLCLLRRRGGGGGGGEGQQQKEGSKSSGGGGGASSSSSSGWVEIPLDPLAHRTGDVWHVTVRNLRDPQDLLYAWRADGTPGGPGAGATSWMAGGGFHPGFLLLDPYAPSAALAELPPDEALLAAGAPALPPSSSSASGPRRAILGSLAPLLELSVEDQEGLGGWAEAARLAESVAPSAARGCKTAAASRSAWRRPRRSLASTVVFEVDLRAFSSAPSVPEPLRGTYLGALSRLDELVQRGATAVVLRGAMLSDEAVAKAAGAEEEDAAVASGRLAPPARRPLSYFAPEVALCCADEPKSGGGGGGSAKQQQRQDEAAPRQLRALIAGAHARGLEVLLEADFCLTADAAGGGSPGAGARLQSLAGLDGAIYLRGGGGFRGGGGGVLNAGQPAVRALALASLRRWSEAYRADGFVLANAENLAQDAAGAVQDSPPVAEELAADGALGAFRGALGGGRSGGGNDNTNDDGGLKIVAAVSDRGLLPRGGGRGFPHYGRLAEWNARFGEDALWLLRDNGEAGSAGGEGAEGSGGGGAALRAFATRLAGSPDLFAPAPEGEDWPGGLAAGRGPAWGLNALQPPGARRAPLALLSSVGGWGGDEDGLPADEALVVARSFLLAQAVSAGVPALDCRLLDAHPALARFAGVALALRRRHAALLAPGLFDAPAANEGGRRDLRWHAAFAGGAEPDWSGELAAQGGVAGANFIAFSVFGAGTERTDDHHHQEEDEGTQSSASGAAAARPWEVVPRTPRAPLSKGAAAAPPRGPSTPSAVYVAFNPDPFADVVVSPPPAPRGARWRRVVDTSRASPADAVLGGRELLEPGSEYVLSRRAALMLEAVVPRLLATEEEEEEVAAGEASLPPPPSSSAAASSGGDPDALKRAAKYLS
jgi:pullulanase/glycogen debranching enzyme